MQVANNTVVAVDYTLTGSDGEVIDSSQGGEPLSYLHGAGGIIPGLERELEGKSVGDQLQVVVQPEDGYGEYNDALVQTLPREDFSAVADLEVGLQFQVESNVGPIVVTITQITDDEVTIDGNHALAGEVLNFDVTIREVREATAEEIDHGHAH